MTLTCLAIVGKDNEPLYLRDAENVKLANGNGNSKQEAVLDPTEEVSADIQDSHDDNDVFGILAWNNQPDSLTIRHEFMMHAALDRLEEKIGTDPGLVRMLKISRNGWVGFLCQMDEAKIYGYVTITNIKILAMIQDESITGGVRESDLKTLFLKVHDLFVHYMLNPFSDFRQKIESKGFDAGVYDAIRSFNSNYNEGDAISWI